jgi:hypothetical protein
MRNRIKEHGSEVVFKIASHLDELWGAFRLIQKAYEQRGLAVPNESGMRVTDYHSLPSTEVVIGVENEEVICTASIVHDASMGLPMEVVYKPEVNERRQNGISVAEVSCLADKPSETKSSFTPLSRLMSLIAQSSKRRGVDELLIAVHPRHAGFYERYLGFARIGPERCYPSVRNLPALALSLDLNNLSDQHPRAYQRLFGEPFPVFTLERQRIAANIWSNIRELIRSSQAIGEAQTA